MALTLAVALNPAGGAAPVYGASALLPTRTQTLEGLLATLAERLARVAQDEGLPAVGVIELTHETALGEMRGPSFGYLGRWCADELDRRLVEAGHGRLEILDRSKLRRVMADQGLRVEDLGSAESLRRLAERLGGVSAFVRGTVLSREGRVVNLQCKLVRVRDGAVVATVDGSAALNESEWAMLGRSALVAPGDRDSASEDAGGMARSMEDRLIEQLDEKAESPHPLKGPDAPFDVRILVGGRERPGTIRGNDCLVPVRDGEVYQVEVENRTDRIVCMRLLVDGLNTLPEKEDRAPGTRGIDPYVWARPVKLDEARFWVLDPAVSRRFRVSGFVTETGEDGKLREFTVGRAEDSLAARQQFTESIGLITVAFYEAVPASSGPRQRSLAGVGTVAGREVSAALQERAGVEVGPLRAVYHLRLVDADELGTGP